MNLTNATIDYSLHPDESVWIKITHINDKGRRVNLRRPFKANGPIHRRLYKEYPDLFVPPEVSKSWSPTWIPTSTIRKLGFKSKIEMLRFIRAYKIKSMRELNEARKDVEPIIDFVDITKSFKLSDWQSLGFSTRKDGEVFAKLLRSNNRRAFLSNLNLLKRRARRYIIFKRTFRVTDTVLLDRQWGGANQSYAINHEGIAGDYEQYREMIKSHIVDLIHRFQGNEPRRACTVSINLSATTFCPLPAATPLEGELQRIYNDEDFEDLYQAVESDAYDGCKNTLRRRAVFKGGNQVVLIQGNDAENIVDRQLSNIAKDLDHMEGHVGSGWFFLWTNCLYVNLDYRELSHAKAYLPLPEWLANKKACKNPHNHDLLCFFWCLVIAKHESELTSSDIKDHSQKLRKLGLMYQQHENFRESNFPMKLCRHKWNHYEDLFKVNIWVWGVKNDEENFVQLESSPRKYERDVLLLFFTDPKTEESHYVYCHRPGALMRAHTGSKHWGNVYPCLNCAAPKTSPEALNEHLRLCMKHEPARQIMPSCCGRRKKGETEEDYEKRRIEAGRPRCKFNSFPALLDVPCIGHFDVESHNVTPKAMNYLMSASMGPDPKRKAIADSVISHQVVNSAKIIVELTQDGTIWHEETFTGEKPVQDLHCPGCTDTEVCKAHRNPMRQLIDAIKMWSYKAYQRFFTSIAPIRMTKLDHKQYEKAVTCVICEKNLREAPDKDEDDDEAENPLPNIYFNKDGEVIFEDDPTEYIKVQHHCHFSGKYIGAAHKSCNLKVRVVKQIPWLALNFSGYDSHPLVQNLWHDDAEEISILPDNTQKYKSVTMHMVDRANFLPVEKELLACRPQPDYTIEVPTESLPSLQADHNLVIISRGKDVTVVRGGAFFKAVCTSINNARKNKYMRYTIDFKDSMLFLQDSLAGASNSLSNQDFRTTREHAGRMLQRPSCTLEHLKQILHDHSVVNDSQWNDPKRLRFMKLICEIMHYGKKEMERAEKTESDDERLKLEDEAFKIMRAKYVKFVEKPNVEMFNFMLNRRKGVYPYDSMTDKSQWENTSLPPIEAYFSKLHFQVESFEELTDKMREELEKDYTFAQLVWRWYNFETFRENHMHYLDLDVNIHVDVIRRFRGLFREGFGIEPLHFTTLPAAGWASALKYTKANFELFGPEDLEMYLFSEAAIRGGVSTVGTIRHGRANNPSLGRKYNKKDPTSWLYYIDANSLYQYIMCQLLPYGGYRWIPHLHSFMENLLKIEMTNKGYLVEVDVHIKPCIQQHSQYLEICRDPCHPLQELVARFRKGPWDLKPHPPNCTCLHDYQADYPCLPENHRVRFSELSARQKDDKTQGMSERQRAGLIEKDPYGDEKLMPTLLPKTKYIVHLKTLQLAMKLGWEVTMVHRALEFRQKAWLKPFIDYCILKRKEAKKNGDAFGDKWWKLMGNSTFGKTMEDVRGYSNVEVLRKPDPTKTLAEYEPWETASYKRYKRLVNDPLYSRSKGIIHLNDELAVVHRAQSTVRLNKPIIVGAAILDLSKHHMQTHWYKMKDFYGDRLTLVCTDTDSFIFHVETEDFMRDIDKCKAFDDNEPGKYKFGRAFDDSEPGMFSFEHSLPMEEAAAIRSKMYSLKFHGTDKTKATLKGLKKDAQKSVLFDEYVSCIHDAFSKKCTQWTLRARDHCNGLEKQTKRALSSFNDKSYLMKEPVRNAYLYSRQLPWGHRSIEIDRMGF